MRTITNPSEVAWFIKRVDVAVAGKGNFEGIDGTTLTGRKGHECFVPQSAWDASRAFIRSGQDSVRNVIFDVTPEGYAAATEFELKDMDYGTGT